MTLTLCRNGHSAPRNADGRCIECKREKDARYYVRNAERLKQRAAEHYAANRDAGIVKRRAYHAAHKDDPNYQAVRKAYIDAHHERLLAIQRERNATPEEKARRAAKRKENAHKYRGYEQKRRARMINAVPKWFGEFDESVLQEAAELCVLRERTTGATWDVDHMVPLLARRASGLHCATNVQVIPTLLNRRKNNRMLLTEPLEWLSHI